MEKLMFKYLNGVYPTAYIYRCKFGEVLYLDDGIVVDNHYHIRRGEVVVQLVSLFSCDERYAYDVFDSWQATLPVYSRLGNSTNDNVLVPLKTVCNSTVS
jgi:hypothetical protein